jgi:protein-L-isoaspartate(D-aspartate) O-methyltransferase
MNFEIARTQMLGQQLRAWDVLDERVLDVVRATPRELFVAEPDRELAFADTEIPLGHDQLMLSPKIEGRLLQALQVEPVDDVLEIGTGSGFLTACLARLGGRVTSVEIFSDFVATAGARLAELGVRNVELETADGLASSYSGAFDAIAVTGSIPNLTEHFIRMLRPHGRLFVVVGRPPIMEARLITMQPGGQWTQQSLFDTVIKPLIHADQPEPFVL